MARLLVVKASPRRSGSRSTDGCQVFLDALARQRSDLVIDWLDLWAAGLPEFEHATIAAKYARLAGRAFDAAEEKAWDTIGAIVGQLKAADAVVIATPMWNFGIPYKLKHWIDLITQPGLTFSFSPDIGYRPLLSAKPTLVILASAGDYSDGPSFGRPDLATPYLKAALGFIGLADPIFVPIGPTIGAADKVEAGRERALAHLAALAQTFMGRRAA